jgi:hypothetical protein
MQLVNSDPKRKLNVLRMKLAAMLMLNIIVEHPKRKLHVDRKRSRHVVSTRVTLVRKRHVCLKLCVGCWVKRVKNGEEVQQLY